MSPDYLPFENPDLDIKPDLSSCMMDSSEEEGCVTTSSVTVLENDEGTAAVQEGLGPVPKAVCPKEGGDQASESKEQVSDNRMAVKALEKERSGVEPSKNKDKLVAEKGDKPEIEESIGEDESDYVVEKVDKIILPAEGLSALDKPDVETKKADSEKWKKAFLGGDQKKGKKVPPVRISADQEKKKSGDLKEGLYILSNPPFPSYSNY